MDYYYLLLVPPNAQSDSGNSSYKRDGGCVRAPPSPCALFRWKNVSHGPFPVFDSPPRGQHMVVRLRAARPSNPTGGGLAHVHRYPIIRARQVVEELSWFILCNIHGVRRVIVAVVLCVDTRSQQTLIRKRTLDSSTYRVAMWPMLCASVSFAG